MTVLSVLLRVGVSFGAIRLTANWAYTFGNLTHQDWRYTMLSWRDSDVVGRGFVRGLSAWYLVAGAVANTILFLAVSIPMAYKRQSRKDGFAEYKKQIRMLLPIKKIISYIRERYDYALDYCRYTFRCVCRGDLNSCQMRYQKN